MIYQFPDQNTLQLALTSGAISSDAAVSPAKFAMAADGSVWVDSQIKLSKESRSQLKAWNVVGRRSPSKAGAEFKSVGSWLQIVPVHGETGFLQTGEKTPVLFELSDESVLPEFVNEILRQGNDRQAFRTVGNKDGQVLSLIHI